MLNKPSSVQLCSDKIKSLQVLGDSGINVPEFTDEFPMIGRTKRHHSGNGFWLCLNQYDKQKAINEGAEYFIEYIPVRTEYRVHVFRDKVIDVRRKAENELFEGTPDQYVRSIHKGWKFLKVNPNNFDESCIGECINSVELLGLDYGAVDVLLGDNGEYYVLEVNSSPGLKPECSTLGKYVEEIKKLIPEQEITYTQEQVNNALTRILRHTRLYNKPFVLVNEFKKELKMIDAEDELL